MKLKNGQPEWDEVNGKKRDGESNGGADSKPNGKKKQTAKQSAKPAKQYTESKWLKALIEYLKSECPEDSIPIMSKIKRGAPRQRVNFDQYRSAVEKCQRLFENNPHDFRSRSEVDRAVHYLGIQLLEYIFTDDKTRKLQKLGEYFSTLNHVLEPARLESCLVDTCVSGAKEIHENFKRGIYTAKQMHSNIEDLVSTMPKKLKPLLDARISRVLSGEKITDLMEASTWGGDRRSQKE